MAWSSKHLFSLTIFDDLAAIHHCHMASHAPNDGEVMGDEQDSHAEFALEFTKLLEDLGLDGDIKRRGWLIGDQKVRSR